MLLIISRLSITKKIINCKKNKQYPNALNTDTHNDFRAFLDEIDFLYSLRLGPRGQAFTYPEWLIMIIVILSEKLNIKTYIKIHKTALMYWEMIIEGLDLTLISRRQLKERQKKASFPFKISSGHYSILSWTRSMPEPWVPIKWRITPKDLFGTKRIRRKIIPKVFRCIGREATWC